MWIEKAARVFGVSVLSGWWFRLGRIEVWEDHPDGLFVLIPGYVGYRDGDVYPHLRGRGALVRAYLPGEPKREAPKVLETVRRLREAGVPVLDCPMTCVCEAVVSKILVNVWLQHRRAILHGRRPEERIAGAVAFFQELEETTQPATCSVCGEEVPVPITLDLLSKLGI